MVLGEVFLGAFLSVLFNKLASPELLNFALRGRIDTKLEKLKRTLTIIREVLDDAEEKQLTNRDVKMWLGDLNGLAYDVEDILDEFATEVFRRKFMEKPQASTSKVRNLIPTSFTSFSPRAVKFSVSMGSKIDEITSRLQEIAKQRDELGLSRNTLGSSNNVWKRPPSTCLLQEPQAYGRDEDKKKILELLLKDEPSDANFHVIPVVGMGGVGKTTLARSVYNDDAVAHFDLKAWVCVSTEFDFMKITRAILESMSSKPCDLKELNDVQVELYKLLVGKKFLLVLDDFWNKNHGDWNVLRTPFRSGAPGSKIIVTTRIRDVALMMATNGYHKLEHLSDEDCWLVFARHAFENRSIEAHPNLEIIGRKIVKKCGGLPLVAKTLGGLLLSKERDDEWEEILYSKIWALADDESDILPVLRLSYHHLPSHLKRCFAYCAILPKNYEFEEVELVRLWMAEGLIQQSEDNKQLEDLGGEYFHELLSRSIFQPSSSNKSRFVMHDLINDLAQRVAGETCFRLEDELGANKQSQISKVRHSSYIRGLNDGIKKFEAFHKIKCLRTFLPLPGDYQYCCLTSNVLSDLLPKLRCLRSLSLSGYNINELPDSIIKLKHLKYLDLSRTDVKSLPESACSLFNLQTLLLRYCSHLEKLPTNLGNLVNLRHLDITEAILVREMPLGMQELTNLQTLSDFVVGKDTGCAIEVLANLNLRGNLCISSLKNVTDAQNAKEANLKGKQGLDVLLLKWEGIETDKTIQNQDREATTQNQEIVLEMLQPHRKLKELTVNRYNGTKFPFWFGDPSFSIMVRLQLENCEKCTSLPPLGQLPSLKDLGITWMSSVKSVGPEFYGKGYSKPFPSLETLCFKHMSEWEQWIPHVVGYEGFPCLRQLCIQGCLKLSGNLPGHLPRLEKLVIDDCEQLAVSISSLPLLCELEIDGCKEVVHRGTIDFSSLICLGVSNVSKLTCLTEELMRGLRIEELKIAHCEELTVLCQNEVGLRQLVSSLHRLTIDSCPKLGFLVAEEEEEQLQQGVLCALEILELQNCEILEKLPQWLYSLTSLRELTIAHCPRLDSFPVAGLPTRLRVIRIENIEAVAFLLVAVVHNSMCLEELWISGCDSLTSFKRGQLPPSLKKMTVDRCENLRLLLDEEEGSSSPSSSVMHKENVNNSSTVPLLGYLKIVHCYSLTSLISRGDLPASLKQMEIHYCAGLTSLTPGGKLPAGLKHLWIRACSLEWTEVKFHNNTSLESIVISSCPNLSSLPEDLHNLGHLRRINIYNCRNLRGLPMDNLTSLQELCIENCESILSFPGEGFPPNLTTLAIIKIRICKPLFECGLHRLTSLTELSIHGGCTDVVSFPQEEVGMMLPTSLISLSIADFPNLEYLSSQGFQSLTSLEYLRIYKCPKLKFFPKKELPPSLLQLCIIACPMLKPRCNKDKGREWSKIARIPYVKID